MSHRGFVLILSSPSGAGKSTLASFLVEEVGGVRRSVSTTTRRPRIGERDGVDYFFTTPEAFHQQVAAGGFLEWAEVFGNFYGTSRAVVEQAIGEGHVLLLAIDWQGARNVRAMLPPEDVVSVSILPPSLESLRQRLANRGQDDEAVIQRRMDQATAEMSHWNEYDYLALNDELTQAQSDLASIVRAERLRRHRLDEGARRSLASFGLQPAS
ncbi:MAG: guanylate kinase [Magnetococcales bacterium]|nr:guanylate kinase [Magnetococcales bacterium]